MDTKQVMKNISIGSVLFLIDRISTLDHASAQGETTQPPTVPVQKNVLLYLNPATIAARRLSLLQFWERRHLITLRSPSIVLCTAQCSPSVPWQCYHENTTIIPLSLQCLSTLSLQVPLGLVSLRDRPSKNDPITVHPTPDPDPPPCPYTVV